MNTKPAINPDPSNLWKRRSLWKRAAIATVGSGVVTLAVLAILIARSRPEALAVEHFEQFNAGLYYDFHKGGICEMSGKPEAPEWAIRLCGLHVFHHVVGVGLVNKRVTDEQIHRLRNLPRLKWVMIDSKQVTDAAVESLIHLPKLEFIQLWNTQVTPDAVAKLQQALPDCRIDFRKADATTD